MYGKRVGAAHPGGPHGTGGPVSRPYGNDRLCHCEGRRPVAIRARSKKIFKKIYTFFMLPRIKERKQFKPFNF